MLLLVKSYQDHYGLPCFVSSISTAALSEAAEVRVGFQLGEGRPEVAKMTAYKAAYLGAIIALFSTGLLFCVAEQVPRWLTPDPTIQRMIFETLPLVRPYLTLLRVEVNQS